MLKLLNKGGKSEVLRFRGYFGVHELLGWMTLQLHCGNIVDGKMF